MDRKSELVHVAVDGNPVVDTDEEEEGTVLALGVEGIADTGRILDVGLARIGEPCLPLNYRPA